MGVLYSIYDALVSVNVPNDKARAVVDAMEQDLLARLVTKGDFSSEMKVLRLETSSRFELLSKDLQAGGVALGSVAKNLGDQITAVKEGIAPQIKADLAEFENRQTKTTINIVSVIVGIATIVLGSLQIFF